MESAAADDAPSSRFTGNLVSHHPVSLSRGRYFADQFSPAALDGCSSGVAFSGLETMKRAYAHAIAGGYRFIRTATRACCFARVIRVRSHGEHSK